MVNTRATATAIAILLCLEPNIAKSSTVGDLVKSCGSSIDSAGYSYCLGVMSGAEDMASVATFNELHQQSKQETFPLPNDPQTGKPFTDARLAIIAIDQDILRLARFTAGAGGDIAREKIMALRDWRDRIGQSLKPSRVSSGDLALDICFGSPEPDLAQLADAFVAWARAYPAANNWDESLGLAAAFREKWPCGSISH
jgi:hypothetical protein